MKIPTIDVPQANSLRLVGELLTLVYSGVQDKRTLSRRIGIVPREVDYYKHAARILGFAAPTGRTKLKLTESGLEYLKSVRPHEKRALLRQAARNAAIFRRILATTKEADLTKETIASFLRENTMLTGSTPRRRAATIIAWLRVTSPQQP